MFKDRREAGQLLAERLSKYKNESVVVYALPRGGVVTALPIAQSLAAPLDLVITRKIGHPHWPEYAIGAVAEDGHVLVNEQERAFVDTDWFENEKRKQQDEAKRRHRVYIGKRKSISVKGKIAILVDDGVATGLTLRLSILEIKHHQPRKIVVAVPVVPLSIANSIRAEVDELVALQVPTDNDFLGAVGEYYNEFSPVTDKEVIIYLKLLNV